MLRYQYSESNEFGKRLRRLRKAAGLTLQDLADRLNDDYGMHANKGTISKYENGIHEPNASTVYCIAQVLSANLDYLLGKSDVDYPSILDQPEQIDETGPVGPIGNYSYDMPDNSMSPHYRIGDVLIVRTEPQVEDGRIYMVQKGKSDPMIRRISKKRDCWLLETENTVFESTVVEIPNEQEKPNDLKVYGRVIEYRRTEI